MSEEIRKSFSGGPIKADAAADIDLLSPEGGGGGGVVLEYQVPETKNIPGENLWKSKIQRERTSGKRGLAPASPSHRKVGTGRTQSRTPWPPLGASRSAVFALQYSWTGQISSKVKVHGCLAD